MRCVITLLFGLLLAGAASAHSFEAGDLTVDHPWARATPPGAPTAVVYLTVETRGAADRLIAVSTPVAGQATLHRSMEENGTSRMQHVDSVEVSEGEPAVLAPGGLHIMLMELKAPLVEGERFPMTLRFEHAGEVEVEVHVEALGTVGGSEDGHAH